MSARSSMQPQPNPVPSGNGGARPGIEGTTHRIVVVDRGWRIESVHPDVLTLIGNTDRELPDLVGQTFWDGFPALVGTVAEQRLRSAMENHTADDFELHYPVSGTWIDVRARPHWPALSIYVRDITAAKQPAGTSFPVQRSSTEKPRVVDAAAAPSANLVCAFDREARLTHASEALLERWNIRLPLARGRTILELNYPTPVAERLHRQIQRVISTGQPIKDDISPLHRDGRTEAHEHIFSPLLGHDGMVHGVAGAIRIVADRQTAVSAPPKAIPDRDGQRAKILGEVAAEFFSADQRHVSVAALFERIAAAVGADCYLHHRLLSEGGSLVLESSSGIVCRQLASFAELPPGEGLPGSVAQQRKPIFLAHVQSNRDAATRVLREAGMEACMCHPLKSGEKLIGTLLLATRTPSQFGEDELRFIQSATALLSARLNGGAPTPEAEAVLSVEPIPSPEAAPLAELSAAPKPEAPVEEAPPADPILRREVLEEDFLSAVVQELRVPLESTLQQVRTIAANPSLPAEVREELDTIARSLATESRLVSDLLDLSRITRGELSIEPILVDLHTLLRDAVASVGPDLAANGIMLAMNLPEVAPQVNGDPVRLQQVLWNLLKRAIKSTPRGGVVSVQLNLTAENTATIAITDTGAALSPAEIARVFEPWANAASRETAGTDHPGFGMATVRKMVELHAGKIEALCPEPGCGTRFVVDLPLATNPFATNPAEGSPSRARAPIRPVRPAGQSPRLLLVEDHAPTRDALLVLLRRGRHEVIVATNAREARGLASQNRFDLVLSAVNLPDGSGYELMAALRLEHGLSGIALIGNGTEQDFALARTAGFVTRLTKPVSIDALEKALAAHVPA